jgi:hypothetical protein
MPDIKVYLNDDEMEYVRRQGKGWIRNLILRFRDTEVALTPEELVYLRDHGGTKGVIRLAQTVMAAEPQVDPDTGEVL